MHIMEKFHRAFGDYENTAGNSVQVCDIPELCDMYISFCRIDNHCDKGGAVIIISKPAN